MSEPIPPDAPPSPDVSPSLAASIDRRYTYRHNVEHHNLITEELATCSDSLTHWINTHVFTYDPRLTPATIPFDLWPAQEKFLHWLEERERTRTGGLGEKSRDWGASFLCCAFALHRWLFREGYAVGFGSRKFEYVDQIGDPKSLFQKIRSMLYSLPPWMMPAGFDRDAHDNEAKLINPANSSTIVGEGGDNIGRGARVSMYFVDEAAHLLHPHLTDQALSATTNCRIDISTPCGMGNPFYQKRHSGTVSVFTMIWRDDPRKDDAWYAEQCRLFDKVTVAQEIDLDYTASIEGVCIPAAWVRAAVELELPGVDGKPYEPTGPVAAGLDVGEERDLSVFISRQGPVIHEPEAWNKLDTTRTAWKADELARKRGVDLLMYDADGIGCIDGATLIDGVPVAERVVPGEVRTLAGRSQSSPGYAKGKADLYRVKTQSGRTVTVTVAHRFLSPDGWLPLSRLSLGSLIAADDSEDAIDCWGKPRGLPDRYLSHCYPCGGQRHRQEVETANKASPLAEPVCVGHDFSAVFLDRLSIVGFFRRALDLTAFYRHLLYEEVAGLVHQLRQGARQWLLSKDLLGKDEQSRPCEAQYCAMDSYLARYELHRSVESLKRYNFGGRTRQRLAFDYQSRTIYVRLVPTDICGRDVVGDSHNSPRLLQELSLCYRRNSWDTIQDISFVKHGDFYDLHVPIYNHYSAAGLWHHNSGVKGTFANADKPVAPKYTIKPLRGGWVPTNLRWPDGRASSEKFINLRAELWGLLRARFEKAFEYRTQGIKHKAEEMISIPNCPQLIAELSLPLRFPSQGGKGKLESKIEMKKRGVKSPNFGDALAYSEFPGGTFDAPTLKKEDMPAKRETGEMRPSARVERLGGLFGEMSGARRGRNR